MSAPEELHIIVVRHGQTDSNAAAIIQGHLPVPLNDVGRAQAGLLAKRLAAYQPRIECLISSDLPRAMQTAEPIARVLQLPILQDPAWRERFLGPWQGKPVADVNALHHAAGTRDFPGAEPVPAFQDRILYALNAIPGHRPGAKVFCAVTHGGGCRCILHMLADGRLPTADPGPIELVPIANCSIMHLVRIGSGPDARWRLQCLNEVAHLNHLGTVADAG